jgi:hypothetical protein
MLKLAGTMPPWCAKQKNMLIMTFTARETYNNRVVFFDGDCRGKQEATRTTIEGNSGNKKRGSWWGARDRTANGMAKEIATGTICR